MAVRRSHSCDIDESGPLLSTVISAQELLKKHDSVKQSGLLMVKVNRHSWKQRFVILTKDRLLVYKKPTSLSPLENIRLSEYQGIRCCTAKSSEAIWAFELFQTYNTLQKSPPAHKFSCCSDSDRLAWMADIKHSLLANCIDPSDSSLTRDAFLHETQAENMYKHLEALKFTDDALTTHMESAEGRRVIGSNPAGRMCDDNNDNDNNKQNKLTEVSPSNTLSKESSQGAVEIRKKKRILGADRMSVPSFQDSGLWEEDSSSDSESQDAPFREDQLKHTDKLFPDDQKAACSLQIQSRRQDNTLQIQTYTNVLLVQNEDIQNKAQAFLPRTSDQNNVSSSQPQSRVQIETTHDLFQTSAQTNDLSSAIKCDDRTYEEEEDLLNSSSLETMCSTVDSCLSPEELLSLLKSNAKGTYLIRKSRVYDQKILSVHCGEQKIADFPIYVESFNKVTIDKENGFDSINDLLKAYTEELPLPNRGDLKLVHGIHYTEMRLKDEKKSHDYKNLPTNHGPANLQSVENYLNFNPLLGPAQP